MPVNRPSLLSATLFLGSLVGGCSPEAVSGGSCTVEDNGDGTAVILCDDGSTAEIGPLDLVDAGDDPSADPSDEDTDAAGEGDDPEDNSSTDGEPTDPGDSGDPTDGGDLGDPSDNGDPTDGGDPVDPGDPTDTDDPGIDISGDTADPSDPSDGPLPVYTGDFVISSTADFLILDQYSAIDGSLLIYGYYLGSDVPSLDTITYVTGDVSLISIDLWDGNGLYDNEAEFNILNNLETIGGTLYLIYNDIDTFSCFGNLTEIGGDFEFTGWWNTGEFTAFGLLQSVGGDFRLSVGGATDLSAFAALSSIGGDFELDDYYELSSLDDLSSLTSIGGDVFVDDTDISQASFDAFIAGVTVGGTTTFIETFQEDNVEGE